MLVYLLLIVLLFLEALLPFLIPFNLFLIHLLLFLILPLLRLHIWRSLSCAKISTFIQWIIYLWSLLLPSRLRICPPRFLFFLVTVCYDLTFSLPHMVLLTILGLFTQSHIPLVALVVLLIAFPLVCPMLAA